MPAHIQIRDSLRALLFLALPLFICSTTSLAMNDTDAVVAEGLFPIEHGLPLALKSERVSVALYPKGLKVMRRYEIENTGESPIKTRLATTCLPIQYHENDRLSELYSAAYASTEGTVDGVSANGERLVGRLVDAGTHVTIQEISLAEIEYCERSNDGDICGQPWISFPVEFAPGQTRTVEINYTKPGFSPRFLEYAFDRLQLYAEKFWCNDSVPVVELDFRVEGIQLEENVFLPRGEFAAYSHPPSRHKDGVFFWRNENYVSTKKNYSYTTRIVHSRAVDLDTIFKCYGAISAPSALHATNSPLKVKLYCKNRRKDPSLEHYEADAYIERVIPASNFPLLDTLKLLLSTSLTDLERASGLESESEGGSKTKEHERFQLTDARIEGRSAILVFEDPDFFTSGGSAWASIMKSQFVETALQFQEVLSVEFVGPDHLFQP